MGKLNLLAACAFISMTGQAAVAGEKAKNAPVAKKICKVTKTTSSRIAAKRICRTAAEWAQASNQEELDDAAAKLRGISRGN